MAKYALEYAGSGEVVEIVADNDTDAEAIAIGRIGSDAVAAGQWDADGYNDDGQPMERLLIWATEEDSINDDGAKAVAQLTAVRA